METLIKKILLESKNEHHLSNVIMDYLYQKCHICKKYIITDKRSVLDKKQWIHRYVCQNCFNCYRCKSYYTNY